MKFRKNTDSISYDSFYFYYLRKAVISIQIILINLSKNHNMKYQKSQMIYSNYKWTAKADHDNPKIIGAQDSALLNREEGYEMLYFINSLALTWKWEDNLTSLQKLERIIKTEVPSNIRKHSEIKNWIQQHYKTN